MIYLAIERYCDAEDPFWSNCKILGAFNNKKDAKQACIDAKDQVMNDDPGVYEEFDSNNDQLFAIISDSGITMMDWKIETIKEVK